MPKKSNTPTGTLGTESGTGLGPETVGRSPAANVLNRPLELGAEMVLNHCNHLDRLISVLKETIERRVYDDIIDGAVQSLELRIFLLRSEVEKHKET